MIILKAPWTVFVALALLSTAAFSQYFSTNFDGSENPLSENGAWSHSGLDWKKVQKVNGIAYGTQTGSGGYDDSYAYLSGFPADYSVSAVIQRTGGSSGNHEVELLLRWSDGPHSAQGYECLMPYTDQLYSPQIVRWNGPLGNFTYLVYESVRVACKTGDVFSASITGDLIVAYLNGVEIMRARDSTYRTGNPGIGFYRETGGASSDMAFTSFSAVAAGTNIEMMQRELSVYQPGINRSDLDGTLTICDLLGRETASLLTGNSLIKSTSSGSVLVLPPGLHATQIWKR